MLGPEAASLDPRRDRKPRPPFVRQKRIRAHNFKTMDIHRPGAFLRESNFRLREGEYPRPPRQTP